ncbi:MAG: MFS transporter [Alphaproteobacteria bacterium]|nr:MFS transporter [Alphaproteobacteria bacterium]
MIGGGGLENIKRAFENRNYRLYVYGNLASTTGNWVQRVAMGWLTWELTHSGAWLGIIAFADLFPTFAIGLFAGAVADRMDALKMLRITQMFAILQALGLTAVTLTGHVTVEWLLFFALFRGIVIAFNRPPRMTLVYNIVGRQELSSAIAINSMIFNSTRFVGPMLGGGIVATLGAASAFAFNGLSYAVFVAVLYVITITPTERPERKPTSIGAETWAGLRYAFGQEGILLGLIILLLTSLFVRPFTELLPGITSAVFDRGVNGYSVLLAFHGIGAMIGAFWLVQRGGAKEYAKVITGSLLVVSIALIVFATAGNFWVALPIMAITGAIFVILGVATQTLLQTTVATEFRGRVMAAYGIVARGAPSLGALIMGGLSEYLGLAAPVAGGAVLCLFLWAWVASRKSHIERAMQGPP